MFRFVELARFGVEARCFTLRYSTIKRIMSTSEKLIDLSVVHNDKGEFVRKASSFRNWITKDGSSGFPAATGRYHLYVSLACPWAHRTLIVRRLKGLENVISVNVVDHFMGEKGWSFDATVPDATADTVNGCTYIKDVYFMADKDYQGRFTVPVLWDKEKKTIVSNESSEIIRMFNSQFNEFCETEEQRSLDLYPEHLRKDIDAVNEWIYPQINNGVYRSGFAGTQEAYDVAVREVFQGLDRVEDILSQHRYLTGSTLTEADIRLFTTLVRFDSVYHVHFKCNKKKIVDYPNIWGFTRELYQHPAIRPTVNRTHIDQHYYRSHSINPSRIVPIGPDTDFEEPHNRDTMSF